jgi:hypothetical protein
MMKKLLVLMLVLGIASTASATLQISAGGVQEPEDSTIWLAPSETIILDIWTDTDITPGVGEGYWSLTALTTDATVSGGVSVLEEPGNQIYAGGGAYTPTVGDEGPWMSVALTTLPSIAAGTTIFDDIVFHCEREPTETVVELWFHAFNPDQAVLVDTLLIHQIPEPMTVGLLGLGGLFLLRRRK